MKDWIIDLLTNPDYDLWTWTAIASLLAIIATFRTPPSPETNKS